MAEGGDLQLVSDASRELVGQLAREELPVFPAFSRAFVRAGGRLPAAAARDQILGFGVDGVLTPLTPVVLIVALEVLKHLIGELGANLARTSWRAAIESLRGTPPPAAEASSALSPSLLAQVHGVALDKARQLKLTEARAELLADAIVGSLVTAGGETVEGGGR